MGKRFLQVDVLAYKRLWIYCYELDLIVKQVIEIVRREDEAAHKFLLETSFKGAVPLRLQVEIWQLKLAADKRLLKARFLNSSGVGKIQTRARKDASAAEGLKPQGDTGNSSVSESGVVNKSAAGNHIQST